MDARRVCVLPGYANSGPDHWQSRWEAADPMFVRVSMPDWENAVCEAWCHTLDTVVAAAEEDPLLIAAHSLGCLTTVFWATNIATPDQLAKVAGALFVAVPDPASISFPSEAHGFANIPFVPLPFPTIVVASSDDPYGNIEFAVRCADAWGSRFVNIGPRGHINAESGLGDWEEGRRLLASLVD
ncbi:MAG TPA: alpha/beta hydrolase [Trinickia sp.]|nr:alpha/beta hydrolase [Trinickia sp.]